MDKYYDLAMTLGKCRSCSGYGKTWFWLGFDFDPEIYWNKYNKFRVIIDKVSLESVTAAREAEKRLHNENIDLIK